MEASFDAMKLKTFKYTELQALAKRYGIRANMKHDKLVQHIKQHLLTSNSSSTESSESSSIPMVDISELQPVKRGRKGASSHKNEQLADAIKELIFSNNNANTNSSPAKSGRNPQASPHKSKKLSSTDLRPAQEAQKPVTKKKGRSRQQKKSVETHQEENHSASSLEPSADETAAAAVQPDSSVTTDVPADGAEMSRRRTRWRTCSQPNEPPPMALKRKRTDEQADHLNMVTERVRKRQRKNETSVAESNVMQSDEDDDEVILNIPIATSETHNHQTTSAEDQGDATRSDEAVEQLKPAVEEEEEKAAASSSQSSPGVCDMVASMQSGMDKATMKASLEEVLERRVQDKQGTAQDSFHHSTATMSTLIPRLTALSGHKTTAANGKRTVTPGNRNWTAIHERQFKKMDSLDVYMRKKHARTNSMMSSSVKQVQQMTEQMRYALTSLKSHKTPQTAKFAKVIKGGGGGGGDKQKSMLFQSPSAPFVPRVTNTTHMNLNFGRNVSNATPKGAKKAETAAKENFASEGRQRLAESVGKPAAGLRKSGIVDSVRKSAIVDSMRKSVITDSVRKMPLLNSVRKSLSTPQQSMSAVKKFDLKSSLAKPITWKPHTGKLQPFQMDQVYNHHQVDVKKVKVQTRDDRRRAADKHRSNQRLNAQMKRRGQLA